MKREFAENTFRMKSLAAAVGLLSGGVHAADFEVTTLSDSGDGSLRWAIDQAESSEGQDNITFASSLSGAINLQSPLPMITEGLSITGPGITLNAEGISVLEGTEPPVINIYTQIPYQTFSLAGMTIRGSDSGAVRADLYYGRYSSVALSDMVVTGNTVRSAIDVNYGNLTITDSVISGNSANRSGAGVSFDYGELSITDSEISNNTTVEGDDGAGISVRDAQFNIADSEISNNTTTYGGNGGGLSLRYSQGVIERSSITGNTAAGSGGGISMGGTRLTVVNSNVDDNSAARNGGGIQSASFYGRLEIQNSSISGNQAGTEDNYGREYYGSGGAIAMFGFPPATSLTLGSSIISGNSAINGGGIRHSGNFAVYGSKITNNSAVYAGALDISVTGGVIFGSTISGNTAENGSVGVIDVERSYGFYGPRIAEPLALGPYGGFTIDSTTISGNTLTGEGEGVTLAAYIDRNASLTIENSTISNNPSVGPVLDVYSRADDTSFTMRNSTMSGNSASASQSVMVVENISDVELVNNTFVDNNATMPSSVSGETAQVSLHNNRYQRFEGPYYGPYISGQMNVNVTGNAMTSVNDKEMLVGGVRLSSNSEYISENDPVAVVLTSNIMEKGVTIDANSTNDGDEPLMLDPMLGALSMQGGFTAVHMPLAGSPVIDGGDFPFRPANRDQRGLQGVVNNFDIGSVEVTSNNTAPKLTVNLPARIGGVVGTEIPVIALADLYSDAEGDTVIVEVVEGLPAGLTWDGTSISGTLERAGTYLVTVMARDDREDSLEAITQVEVVVTETAPKSPLVLLDDDDDDDFLGSVPLGGLALLGFLAALRRRRQ